MHGKTREVSKEGSSHTPLWQVIVPKTEAVGETGRKAFRESEEAMCGETLGKCSMGSDGPDEEQQHEERGSPATRG